MTVPIPDYADRPSLHLVPDPVDDDSEVGGEESRDTRRSRRKHPVKAKVENVHRISRRQLRVLSTQADLDLVLAGHPERPKTRADCENGPRPCMFVSCRHNLFLDVSPTTGAIKHNFPDLEPHQMPADGSCALDVAERGGLPLEAVADLMNWTRERMRQVQQMAIGRISPEDRALLAELQPEPRESASDAMALAGGEPGGEPGGGEDKRGRRIEVRNARGLTEEDRAEIERWSNEASVLLREGYPLRTACQFASEDVEALGTEEPPRYALGPLGEPRPRAELVTPADRRTAPPRSVEHLVPVEGGADLDLLSGDMPEPEDADEDESNEEQAAAALPEETAMPTPMREETKALRDKIVAALQASGPTPPRLLDVGAPRSDVGYAMRTLVKDGLCEVVGATSAARWQLKGDERAGVATAAKPAKGKAKKAAKSAPDKPRPASAPAPIAQPVLDSAGSWLSHLIAARAALAAHLSKVDALIADATG